MDDRFRSRDIGKGSGDIKSAICDIIYADSALLEKDPEAVLVSERTEARLRAAFERLTGNSDTPLIALVAWYCKRLTYYCATGWSAIWSRCMSGWSK